MRSQRVSSSASCRMPSTLLNDHRANQGGKHSDKQLMVFTDNGGISCHALLFLSQEQALFVMVASDLQLELTPHCMSPKQADTLFLMHCP